MDNNPFFRFLGRVNTVLITLTALALLVVIVASQLWFFDIDRRVRHEVVPTAPGAFTFDLGNLQESTTGNSVTVPDGWGEGVMVLNREDGGRAGSFASSSGPSVLGVNLLFIDLKTAKSRWLFHGTARDIVETVFVRGPKTESPPQGPVTALLMTIADADTNHDGKIDGDDDDALYVYRPGDAAATRLIAARDITGVHQPDTTRVLVTYRDKTGDRVALFSTDDYRLLASGPLPLDPH